MTIGTQMMTGAKVNTWRYFSSSVKGPLHERSGLPNQDATLGRLYRWGLAIAIADGLGSKDLSHIGAAMACESVMDAASYLAKNTDTLLQALPRLIHTFWLTKLGNKPITQCASTLAFVIVIHQRCIIGKIGDGMVVVLNGAQSHLCIDGDPVSEFTNVTTCLGESFAQEDWYLTEHDTALCEGIFLCTDGISEDLEEDQKIDFVRGFLDECLQRSKRSRAKWIKNMLTHWPVPGHVDDKTLICGYRERQSHV